MSASQDLPTKGEEEIGREDIASQGEDHSPPHQIFKEALFGWSWVLKHYDESLPLTDKLLQHLTILVTYFHMTIYFFIPILYFIISLFQF